MKKLFQEDVHYHALAVISESQKHIIQQNEYTFQLLIEYYTLIDKGRGRDQYPKLSCLLDR